MTPKFPLALLILLSLLVGCMPVSATEFYIEDEPGQEEQEPFFTARDDLPYQATAASLAPSLRGKIQQYRQQNSDTVGWLQVPGTSIDGVIVQNPSDAYNSYYLNHDFYGSPSKDGVFCADRRCVFGTGSRGELSTLTTLYGHSWSDDPEDALFAPLKSYRDAAFAAENPYIFFSTTGEDMVWEVFAVFDTTVHLPYVWPELDSTAFREMMDVVYRASIYDYGYRVGRNDKILTLSTCVFTIGDDINLPLDEENDYRFVIMARLVGSSETIKERATFTVNQNPLHPDNHPHISVSGQYDV